jgi:signal transduction histidine kinase
MKTSTHPLLQITVIYVATTLFLVALSIYTFIQIRNLIDSSDALNYTHQVKQSLQKILTTITEAESSKQGFLLTKDSVFLQKRAFALYSLSNQERSLDSLLQENTEQDRNFKQLQRIIHRREISLNDIPSGRKPFRLQYEIQSNTREGIQLMDSVREQIETMMSIETHHFILGRQQFVQHSFITPLLIIVFFLGALLILFISYLKLQSELRYSHQLLEQLLLQKEEKEQRATELVTANQELRFQSAEREKRAEEFIAANEELMFQSAEKEKRAAELAIANKELLIQSQEKEKRTVELLIANRDLQLFTQISSHDLKEPLRKLQMAASRISNDDYENLSQKGRGFFSSMRDAASTMQTLIDDLITYSETNREERTFVKSDLRTIVEEVLHGLRERIEYKQAVIEIGNLCEVGIIPFQFRQLMHNILGNALKFSQPGVPPHIIIKGRTVKGSILQKELQSTMQGDSAVQKFLSDETYCHISISDNGIGFEPEYNERIFEVFQRLHGKEQYKGTGIGLAIVKRIIENHNGIITATGTLNVGARFDIYLPHQKS